MKPPPVLTSLCLPCGCYGVWQSRPFPPVLPLARPEPCTASPGERAGAFGPTGGGGRGVKWWDNYCNSSPLTAMAAKEPSMAPRLPAAAVISQVERVKATAARVSSRTSSASHTITLVLHRQGRIVNGGKRNLAGHSLVTFKLTKPPRASLSSRACHRWEPAPD